MQAAVAAGCGDDSAEHQGKVKDAFHTVSDWERLFYLGLARIAICGTEVRRGT